jgi:hypothetical protein
LLLLQYEGRICGVPWGQNSRIVVVELNWALQNKK